MTSRAIAAIALTVGLTGCGAQPPDKPAQDSPTLAAPSPAQPVSILRPDIEQPGLEQELLTSLTATLGFPEGGAVLDAAALSELERVLASEQLALGGPIVLRGHSDSAGSDRVNLDAAQERALAAAEWLIDNGVDPERISVIVFGEQNPVQPNALPDGSPNEAGRAANRRVEIDIPTVSVAERTDPDPEVEEQDQSVEIGD